MSNIDVSQWKEFKLSSMLDICYGSFVPKKDRGTKTPFITTSSENNGISYYVDSDPMFKGDALTVASDGSVGATFYHDKPFSAGNIAVVLEPYDDVRAKWTPKSALFIATCIRKYAQIRHSWTDKYSVNRVRDTMLPLPVDSSGHPDWQYMDSYIAKRAALAHKYVSELANAKDKSEPLSINGWKEFKIDELFDKCVLHKRKKIRREFDLSIKKTLEFDLPVVNAKHDNNGIMYYGRRSDFEITNKVIDIVQDGESSVGDVYPQFGDVSVLFNAYLIKLKNHVPTENQLVYLSTVLQRAVKLYFSYDNKCTWDKLKKLFIKLPVTSYGEPDWHYMDEYIAKRAALSHRQLQAFQQVVD